MSASTAAGATTIRSARPEDLPGVLELLRVSMARERRFPFDERVWRWKHEANPAGPSPCLVAVTPEGRVVGLRAFLRWEWRRGGGLLRAVRAVDTAVHPDWRGAGLFTRLTRDLLTAVQAEGVDFVFNTPNGQSLPGYLKMGWRPVGRMTLWVKPLRPGALLRGGLARLGGRSWPGSASGPGSAAGDAGRSVGEVLDDPRALALLDALAARDADRLETRRTAAFLRWRYADTPTATYRCWFDEAGRALAIARSGLRFGLREGLACELLHADTADGVRAAAAALRSLARDLAADYLLAAAPARSPTGAALALAGFAPLLGASPLLTFRPLRESLDHLAATRAWRLSAGDLELF
ncbi:MAG: GNAT family N-acetyltransferase [Planctomycetes bacterium]|nr:GNAT family N-acetyltransferase [Planctomycetota bacterium]